LAKKSFSSFLTPHYVVSESAFSGIGAQKGNDEKQTGS
jgi:hypothetical protein